MANSLDPGEVRSGFEMISAVASESGGGRATEFGFIDNALFLARKHASSESADLRSAVVSSLVEIGHIGKSWLEAVLETVDEIAAQPSDNSRQVADEARAGLRGR
jgi:hypothetical protein